MTELLSEPKRDPRRHDLDALRAIAMLAGVWLRASMAYFANGIRVHCRRRAGNVSDRGRCRLRSLL